MYFQRYNVVPMCEIKNFSFFEIVIYIYFRVKIGDAMLSNLSSLLFVIIFIYMYSMLFF